MVIPLRLAALGRSPLRHLAACDRGQALTEYALILFLIALVSIGVLWALGVDVATMLDTTENGFDAESDVSFTPPPAP